MRQPALCVPHRASGFWIAPKVVEEKVTMAGTPTQHTAPPWQLPLTYAGTVARDLNLAGHPSPSDELHAREVPYGSALPELCALRASADPLQSPYAVLGYACVILIAARQSGGVHALPVSHNTVKSHMRHIHRKLGVHSQQEPIALMVSIPSAPTWPAR